MGRVRAARAARAARAGGWDRRVLRAAGHQNGTGRGIVNVNGLIKFTTLLQTHSLSRWEILHLPRRIIILLAVLVKGHDGRWLVGLGVLLRPWAVRVLEGDVNSKACFAGRTTNKPRFSGRGRARVLYLPSTHMSTYYPAWRSGLGPCGDQ